jgi:arylsulfatase
MGWDRYREMVMERQKQMGVLDAKAALSPMMDGVQNWDSLPPDEKRLYARMAEVYAGFVAHADHQIGRLIDSLERAGSLENTLIFVFIGDNGSSGEGTLQGLFNEVSLASMMPETLDFKLQRIDQLGQPGSYNHYPIGWAFAGNTPFKLCKQYTHFGGTRNPLVVHWPKGIKSKGEIRKQFHHVIDIVPTILQAAGVGMPALLSNTLQAPIEGVPMNYSFDNYDAPTTHPTQYFEMLGNRAIIEGKWKAVTYNGRLPWESDSKYKSIDEQKWELYDLEEDPAEAHDLVQEKNLSHLSDPLVQKLVNLITLWWAEAGKYNVLPLDDRFQERVLGRGDLYITHERRTFFAGAVRIPQEAAPETRNRSWVMAAHVEVNGGTAEGPICVMGGDSNGWSLYAKDGNAAFCYNLAGNQITYIHSNHRLAHGSHVVRYEFEKTGPEPFGAGGIGRLFVDDQKVGEERIPQTAAFGYTLDETFDIGCDKGSPVTNEYSAGAAFSGKVLKVDFDLKPDFSADPDQSRKADARMAMMRQ